MNREPRDATFTLPGTVRYRHNRKMAHPRVLECILSWKFMLHMFVCCLFDLGNCSFMHGMNREPRYATFTLPGMVQYRTIEKWPIPVYQSTFKVRNLCCTVHCMFFVCLMWGESIQTKLGKCSFVPGMNREPRDPTFTLPGSAVQTQ